MSAGKTPLDIPLEVERLDASRERWIEDEAERRAHNMPGWEDTRWIAHLRRLAEVQPDMSVWKRVYSLAADRFEKQIKDRPQ